MLSVAQARERLVALAEPVGDETVPLTRATGRVLARAIAARRTQPPFPASAMDGYAVRHEEATPGARLRVIGEAAAGHGFGASIGPGQTVRIFTGAPVPDGADDILIQEDTIRDGDWITVKEGRDKARYVRPAGTDFSAGDELGPNRRLTPRDTALLAAMNHDTVPVRRKPVVALIATGDELVTPGTDPGPDQIISSNNYGLAAMLEGWGALPRILPIALDTPEHLSAVLDMAAGADLIVTLGGASVGDHDLVQAAATSRGLDLSFYKVAMRPGKPLMAGRLGAAAMIGLPGNPVSAMVCGTVFVRPVIDRFLGLDPAIPLRTAYLSHDLDTNGPREHYMRARVWHEDGRDLVEVFDRQDSSLLSVLSSANALAVRPPHAAAARRADAIQIVLLD